MKVILTLTILAFGSIVNATDYFISSSGDDQNNSGLSETSPWKTIDKVNSIFATLKPGDKILFKRGEIFFGTIKVSKSGTAGSPITIGSYGSGEKPVITGFNTVTGWTNEGNGIYSSPVFSEAQTNMVNINGKQVPMGRYPDAGSNLVFESFKSNPSNITSAGLGSSVNWTGAEAVINVNDWSLDRCLIKSHSGDILTYTNLGSGELPTKTGRYFFIQNDLKCLTKDEEWYHSTSDNKFYIYGNPSDKSIKISCLNYLIYNNGYDYINIDGLNLSGAIVFGIYMPSGNTYCTVQNSTISFIGESGIRCENGTYHTYDNNIFNDINRASMYVTTSGYFKIINNTISDIGILPGGSYRATQNNGMFLSGFSNSLVQYNNITKTGYNGIYIKGGNTEITNNFINYACILLDDGAAIYTSGKSLTGLVFSGNIILNSGVSNSNARLAEGIYLDEFSANITVKNNSIANCLFAGIKNHKGNNNNITNNTCFNNGTGIFLQNSSSTANVINNLKINGNIFVAKDNKQIALRFYSLADDIPGFGNADYNYYLRPVDDNNVICTSSPSTGSKYRNLKEWQTFSRQDLNSQKSPIPISDTSEIFFYYNAFKSDKTISLPKPMIDITGVKYPNIVLIQPYTSIVLFADPDPGKSAIPVLTSSVIENATPDKLVMTYNVYLAGVSPASTSFSLKVNGANIKINSVAVAGNKVSLVLAERVNYGDNITIEYTKPAVNPLQSTSGVEASSFNDQPVINNCLNTTNQAPVVSINSANKRSSFTAPATFTIEVMASDLDGTIIKVELFNGVEKIGEVSSAPYSFTLKDLPEGSYSLIAIATDNMKSSSTSVALEFQVTSYNENREFFNLYPNPNNGTFSINFLTGVKADIYTLTIINIAGKTVHRENISGESGNTNFNLSHLETGTYIVMIMSNLIVATAKFIKV